MSVEIKLSDRAFPVSPAFIEFLHHCITGREQDVSLHDQLSEVLVPVDAERKRAVAQSVAGDRIRDYAAASGCGGDLDLRKIHRLARVSAVWRTVGLVFPRDEIMECR